MTISEESRFSLICPPTKIKGLLKEDPSQSFPTDVFYFSDHDRRQGIWLAVDRKNRPDIKPWNDPETPESYEATSNARWRQIVQNWLVKWTDELDSKKDILIIDWKESTPYVTNPGDHLLSRWKALFKSELRIRHHCHYPFPRETGFLDEERARFKISELLEIERLGPNFDLVSYRDKHKLEPEKAFFKYAALPGPGQDSLREHWLHVKHKIGEFPHFEKYLHPVMDDKGEVVVGFLTAYFSGSPLSQNVSRLFTLAHVQQLFKAVTNLNEHMKLLHNRITIDNIWIDESDGNKPRAKLTDLGGITAFDSKADDDVQLKDVYALIKVIHAHVVRHPEEIDNFDPKALQPSDTWESHPLVRLGNDFANDNPAQICYNSLQSARRHAALRRGVKRLDLAQTPSIRRVFHKGTKAEIEVDLTTYWDRDPENVEPDMDPFFSWVRKPERQLAETGAKRLATGKIAGSKQLRRLEPPPVSVNQEDISAWLVATLAMSSSPFESSILNSAQKSGGSTPFGSSLKRRRGAEDVGEASRLSAQDREELLQAINAVREATDLAKKAGDEAKEAAKEAKEAAEKATQAKDLVHAARQVAQTSLNRSGPLAKPLGGVAWQI
ncbi:hypothetical protein QBC40DRAFT_73453 [Triangularia verruculosa]|uniref:Protein kinase domain-containing protein n=1 Tax=Triangularia verruculosa TaxID=2587418 RepID=A0AAN6XGE8_9PEZI|nr:hypothetical protein QBC40DRAFT_73453 [Triangularia verruculosa]